MLKNELHRRLEEVEIGSKSWDHIPGADKSLLKQDMGHKI